MFYITVVIKGTQTSVMLYRSENRRNAKLELSSWNITQYEMKNNKENKMKTKKMIGNNCHNL